MISKIYYFIVATLIIATLVACELFTSGYGEKVDLSEPSISISDPVNVEYKGGTFTLKGVASDDTSIKEVVVEFKSPVTNDTKTRTATLSDNNWYLDIDSDDSSIFKDGEVEFTVTAIDSVDKKSSKNIIVYLDNTLPTVLVESPNSQDKDIINGILDVIGSAKDASLEKLEVYIVSSDDPTKRYLGVTEGTSSWKATFNTEKLEIGLLSSQTYYLEVIAYDVAGNQSSYFYYNDDLFSEEMTQIKSDLGINSRPIDMLADINNIDLFESIQRSDSLADRLNFNIYQDRDRPEIILSSDWDLSSPDNLKSFTNSVNLSAQVKDDDGIKTIVLSVYKKSDNSLVRQGTIKPLGSRSYNLDVILDSVNWSGFTMTPDLSSGILPEDSYYFTLTVTDIEGAFSGVADLPNPANFGIDRNNPEVKILSSLSNKYYNSNVDVIIEAKDNVGVTKVDLYINDVDDKTPLSAIKQDDGNWKYTVKTLDYITEEDLDVNLSIKVVASDASGKTDTESMSIYLDILPPVLEDSKITMPASLNQTVEIEVTPVDKNLDSVEYNLDNEEDWKPVSKVDGSTSIITLLTTDYADGNHTLNLKAIDTAGNITELSKIITIDQDSDKPVITFKTPDETNDINSFSGAVTILAELKDDDAIDEESIVLKIDDEKVIASEYIKQNVGGVVTLKYTPTFDDDGDHSVSVFVADKKDIGVVKDVTKNIDFVIDSRGPTINNIKVDSEVISSLMYKKSDFTLSGNAADLKDVSKITIKATFGDSEPVIYVIPFDAVTPNVTWIQIINVDGNVNDSEEKPLTVTIEAIDAAGNSSGIVTKNLIIDKIKPVLDSVLSSNIENLNGIETISGGASDDHLSSVKIAYIGKNDGKTSWLNIEGSPYSWKYYLDTKKIEDGNSTFYVQATDLSGNISNKEYTINIDQLSDKPQFIFDKPIISGGNETTNLFGSSASVSGSVTDDDGIDRGEINIYLYDYDNVLLYTTNFIPTPGGSDKSIPWEFDLSSLSQGIYYIQVEAKDDIDYKLNGDVVSSNISNKNIFAIDFGAPTLDISSPLNATTEITYLNSQMILAGNVKDGLGVKTLTYQLGSLDKVTIFTDKQYLDYNWSKTLTLDELKLAGTSFSINLEATDITGKVIKSTMPVFIDESGPILTVTTPLNNSINESSPISLEGTILDLGSGFSYPVDGDLSSLNYDLAYSLNSGVDVPISLTEGDTKWLKDLELTTEGTYNLKFKSKDRIGNVKNSSNITFYYDKSKPDFTEVDSTYSETEVLTNSSVNFGGHLSDSNGLLAFNVKVNTEDEINLLSSVESNGTWSYTLPKVDGDYSVTFTATDKANRSVEINRKIKIDATLPELNVKSIVSDVSGVDDGKEVLSGNYKFEGSSSDTGSNVKSVYYSLNGNEYLLATGTTIWNVTVDTTSLPEGVNNIKFKATDNSGNFVESSDIEFVVDQSAPILSETFIGSSQKKTNISYTLEGTISDTYGIASLTINGNAPTTNSGGSWTYSVTTPVEGEETYTVVATDNSGRKTSLTRSVLYDVTAPEVDGIDAITGFVSGSSYTFKGVASDDNGVTNSGINKVEYQVTAKDVAVVEEDWVAASGSTSWNGTFALSISEGDKTVHVRVTDEAGNVSVISTKDFVFDQGVPSLAVTTNPVSITKGFFTISGTASDSNGLKDNKINLNVAGTDYLITVTDGSWTYTGDLSGKTDGSYDITVLATDVADRPSVELVKSIQVDKVAPLVEVGTVSPLVNTDEVNGTIEFSATASDPNGLEGVRYWILPSTDEAPSWDTTNYTLFGAAPYSVTGIDTTDTSKFTDGNSYKIWVLARDKAGNDNIDSKLITVNQASDIPTVDFTNIEKITSEIAIDSTPSATKNLFLSTVKIIGTVADDDSVDASTIQVSLNGAAPTGVTTGNSSSNGSLVYWDNTFATGLVDGNNTLVVTATDTNGKAFTSDTYNFFVDKSNPSLTITDNKPAEGSSVKSVITLSGTVSDAHLESVLVTLEGGNVTEATVSGSSWNLVSNASGFDAEGTKTITVTATDKFGKTTEKEISVLYDKTAPTLAPGEIDSDVSGVAEGLEVISGEYIFTGTASDTNSLVSKVEYSLNGAAYELVTGTNSWNVTVDTTSLSEGVNNIKFKATDNSGNFVESSDIEFVVDQSAPMLSETFIGSSQKKTNSSYTLEGTISDTYGIASLKINGNAPTTNSSGSWTYSVTAPVEGEETYTVVATDNSGRKTSLTRSVLYDVTAPEVDGIDAITGFVSGSSYTFKGVASDDNGDTNSGINKVEYQVTAKDVAVVEEDWVAASGSTSWNGTFALNILEGDKTVHVRVTDEAGNVSVISTKDFVFDQGVPSLAVATNPVSITKGTFTIAGTASDSNGLKDNKINLNVAGTDNLITVTDGSWTYTGDLSGKTDGSYDITVLATDVADRPSVELVKSIQVDKVAPLVEVGTVSPLVNTDEVNGTIEFSATASDPNGLEGVRYWILPSTDEAPSWDTTNYTLFGAAPYSVTGIDTTDTSKFTDGNSYKIWVLARDKAGNDKADSKEITVNQASDIPTVDFTNIEKITSEIAIDSTPSATKNLFLSTVKIIGTVADDDSVDASTIQVSLNGAAPTGVTTGNSSSNGSLVYWDNTFATGLVDGNNTLVVTATDTNGKAFTSDTYNFFVDKSNPSLTITDNKPAEGSSVKSVITLSGTVSDAHLDSVLVTLEGGNVTEATVTGSSWNLVSNASGFDAEGTKTITVTATDKFGKTTEKEISVLYDKTAPTLTPGEIDSEVSGVAEGREVISGEYIFTGTASDTNSLVSKVEYSLNGAAYELVTGTNSWNVTVDTTSLTEGVNNISFKAIDNSGNFVESGDIEFVVDQSAPILSETFIGSSQKKTNSSYTLEGTISDTYGIASLTINGNAPTTNSGGSWTYSVTTPVEGEETYTVVATDNSGRKTSLTRSVLYDVTAPEVDGIDAITGFVSGSSYTFKGVASDDNGVTNSGINKVEYQVTAKDVAVVEEDWVAASGSTSWNGTFALSISEGDKTVHVRVTDEAGNVSVISTKDFVFDQGVPSLAVTTNPVSITKGSFTISGTASDSNGLKDNKINLNVAGTDYLITVTDGSWTYTGDLSGKTDGSYDITVLATDVADRPSVELVKSIQVDKVAPLVEVGTVSPLVNTDEVNGTIEFSATASDPNGLEGVRYWILPSTDEAPSWDTTNYTLFGAAPYSVTGIDTTDTSKFTDGNSYKIWVLARDKAGNDKADSKEITVNQASDIPTVDFTNIEKITSEIAIDSTPSATKNLFLSTVKIIGTVADDDSVDASTIQVSLNGGSYVSVDSGTTSDNGSLVSWSHTFSSSDLIEGDNEFTVKVSDINTLAKTLTSEVYHFFVDKSDPVVNVSEPIQSAYVKGSARTSGEAYDGTSLASFTITANNASTTSVINVDNANTQWGLTTTENTGEFYWDTTNEKYIWDFALEQLPDEYENRPITISYNAVDSFDKKSVVDRSITIDSVSPDVDIQYPALDSVVTGSVTIKGITTDEKMKTVEIKLGNSGSWELLDGTYNWSKTINTVATSVYTDGNDQGDGTWEYPVQIRATDSAGNVTIENSYQFYISPDLDKPTVSITSPSNGAKLGGTILLIGTATDNEAVSKVYIRADVNGDGDFVDSYDLDNNPGTSHIFDNESSWTEITNFSNSVWQQEINSDGLLYSENSNITGATGVINIQFKAVDLKGVESLLVTRNIDIDSTFPEITQFEVLDDNSNPITDVKGTFDIKVSTTDNEGGITAIDISYNGGISYESVLSTGSPNVTETLTIPVDSINELGYTNSSDIINVRLKVTDTTGYQSFKSLQLSIDNINPTASYTGRVDDIGTAGGTGVENRVTVSGIYEDTGLVSSFGRIEAYLSQDGVIIDPNTGETSSNTTIDFNDGNGAVVYPDNNKDLITIDWDAAVLERGKDDSGDGDGYYEYISTASGVYNWSAEFDTSSIDTDLGAVELHYVVYDKAGNSSHYVEIMLIVGSDLDDSGVIEESEQMAYPQSFQARSGLLYVELFGGSKANYYLEISDSSGVVKTTDKNTTETTFNTSAYDGETEFIIRVYDYVDGVNDTLKLTKNLEVDMKGADTIPPTITVSDLTTNSVVDGHLDVGDFSSNPATNTNDKDISGELQFIGVAADDSRIKDITLSITGESDVVIAQWVEGLFKSVDPNTTIVSQELHWKDGHTVNFTYNWDTETLTNVADENRVVEFTVNDFIADHTVSDIDQFDVVPYITSITRNGFNTNRSKLGFYPVRREETGLIIDGFNLRSTTIPGSVTIDNISISSTISGSSDSSILIDIPTTARSGYLELTVNGVSAINNSNNNNYTTNSEKNPYLEESELWTDDRYIHIWQSNNTSTGSNRGYFTGSDSPKYPAMTIDNSGLLYASWSNYADSTINYAPNNGNATQIYQAYDPSEHTDISFGDRLSVVWNANIYGNNRWDVTGAGGVYVWDSNANAAASRNSGNAYESELLYHDEQLMQFVNERVITNGNDIHVSYYDTDTKSIKYWHKTSGSNPSYSWDNTERKYIFDNESQYYTWVNLDGYYDTHDTYNTNRVLGGTGSRTDTMKAGEYSAIDVNSNGYPLVAYYDLTNQKVKLAVSSSTNPKVGDWLTQDVTSNSSYTGKFISMRVDSSNYVHMTFYKTSTGDLMYIKSTNNPSDGTAYTFDDPVLIDSNGSVGMWADLTLDGTTPIISYLDSSRVNTFDGLKVATIETDFDINNDGSADTVWETQNIPLAYEADSVRTSVEADTGTNFWDKAVGYGSSDYYRIAYYVPKQ